MTYEFTLMQDTREKEPWDFSWYKGHQYTIIQKLYPGDYTIQGYEDVFAIERKRNVSEISTNLGKDVKRFIRELEDMKKIKRAYLICEFPERYLDTFPVNSGIPKSKWKYLRMNSSVIKYKLFSFVEKYDLKIIFSENAYDAQDRAYALIQEILSGDDDEFDF